MVDSAVVGRYVGKQALASVGAIMSVLNMVIFVIIGLTVGICIITGQSFGAGNEEKVRDTVGAVIYISFVIVFHWGVAGVAWATVLSEAVAALVNLNRIQRKHPILHLRKGNLKPKPAIVKHILAVGIAVSVQNAVTAIGMLGIQGMVNPYGTNTVAAYTAASKIDQIAIQPLNSMGSALSTYVSQNFGKGDQKRIRTGVKYGIGLSAGLGILLMVIILPLGNILPQLFLKANEVEAIHIAQEYLRTVAVFYWLCGMQYIMLNLFRGMGKMKISTFSACMDPVMKLISAWILGQAFGRSALWLAWPIGWAAALIVPVVCFIRGNWMNAKE